MKTISLIVAMDRNGLIGKNNDLPWTLPNDLDFVRKKTMGHTIVLGRKNYESIGKALPKRRNIVMTRDSHYRAEGCEVVHSIEDVLVMCRDEEETFIFGGSDIYKMFLPYVDRMYITRIDHEFEGDVYFPPYDSNAWIEVSSVDGVVNEENLYAHTFYIYERKPQPNGTITTIGNQPVLCRTRMDVYRNLLHLPNVEVIDHHQEYRKMDE